MDALRDLHTALIDAQAGYEKAIEKAEKPDLAALFRDMYALHGASHAEIHSLLRIAGEEPDDSGSLMGVVHKAAISIRSAVTGIDDGSLAAFASGEENILEKYDDAIRDDTNADVVTVLENQRQKLAAKVAEMKSRDV